MLKDLKKGHVSRMPQSQGNFCDIIVKSLGKGTAGTECTHVQYSVETVSQTSLKASPAPLLCRTLLSVWSNLAGALCHASSSISNSSKRERSPDKKPLCLDELKIISESKSMIRFDEAGRIF